MNPQPKVDSFATTSALQARLGTHYLHAHCALAVRMSVITLVDAAAIRLFVTLVITLGSGSPFDPSAPRRDDLGRISKDGADIFACYTVFACDGHQGCSRCHFAQDCRYGNPRPLDHRLAESHARVHSDARRNLNRSSSLDGHPGSLSFSPRTLSFSNARSAAGNVARGDGRGKEKAGAMRTEA